MFTSKEVTELRQVLSQVVPHEGGTWESEAEQREWSLRAFERTVNGIQSAHQRLNEVRREQV